MASQRIGRWIGATSVATIMVACGSSGNDLFTGGEGGTTVDASAGNGGTAGSDASAGSGGIAGSTGQGGSSGATGKGGSAGTTSNGGSGGTGGASTGGSAGTAAGGTGGAAGKGGAGGTGGTSPCGSCNDGIACTIDACVGTTCTHTVDPKGCQPGTLCDTAKGCVMNPICANNSDCIQKLGSDPCKTNITCTLSTSICAFDWLDKDKDGFPPLVCGGADCNDNDAAIFPSAAEICDGKDNNCDGVIDNGATCSGLYQCVAGACACPAPNACGSECVDKTTSNGHCGQCFNACPSGSTCVNSACQCGAGTSLCASGCKNLNNDPANCGACNAQCASGYTCANKVCTCTKTPCSGSCVDTSYDPSNCGGCGVVCPLGSTCQNSACACGGGHTLCGGACVDTKIDAQNCGGCNQPCAGTCQNGTCLTCVESDLYILQDTSGSTAPPDGGGAGNLENSRQAINTFMAETATNGMGIGYGYFADPLDPAPSTCTTNEQCGCGGSCTFSMCMAVGDKGALSDYSTAKVGIGLMPGNKTAITNAMAPLAAGGGTPPASLQGALVYARGYAQSHAGHKVAVVIIADGLPNECTNNPDTATDWLPSVTAAFNGTPKVLTYAINMGGSATSTGYNQVASAGGTGSAYSATTALGVRQALESIRTAFKTCP